MSRRSQRGFTLVEVLVASVIMFTVLATATLSLRGALMASERASQTVELLAPLPLITSTIRDSLRETSRATLTPEHSGAGALFGVSYRFRAELIRSGSPPLRFEPEVQDFTEYAPRFGLYDVELTLEREGEISSFIYQELAWRPLER